MAKNRDRRKEARAGAAVTGGKRAKSVHEPHPQKVPHNRELPGEDSGPVVWSFERFDHCEHWRGDCGPTDFLDVVGHMRSYEQRTWADIIANAERDHPIETYRLSPEAQKRLTDLNRDDEERLWSFHFTGTQRLWGVKIGRLFQAIWWDPEHKVYPVGKPHT